VEPAAEVEAEDDVAAEAQGEVLEAEPAARATPELDADIDAKILEESAKGQSMRTMDEATTPEPEDTPEPAPALAKGFKAKNGHGTDRKTKAHKASEEGGWLMVQTRNPRPHRSGAKRSGPKR